MKKDRVKIAKKLQKFGLKVSWINTIKSRLIILIGHIIDCINAKNTKISVLHSGIYTIEMLFRMKTVTSSVCSLCKHTAETLERVFIEW